MGFLERLGLRKKDTPQQSYEHVLNSPEVANAYLDVASDLNAKIYSGVDETRSWRELVWPKSHTGSDRPSQAKQLFVIAAENGLSIQISYQTELWDFKKLISMKNNSKSYDLLSLKEKIEFGTRLAEARPQNPSNSVPAEV